MSKTSDMIRVSFREGDAKRDEGLTTPEDIVRYDDILYGDDKQWQVLDVYRPKALEGEVLPVIVSVHGGGWVYGDKEIYQFYCMNLAQRGFAVVNYTYRLAPEFKYPCSLEDCNQVFSWVLRNAQEYGFDKDHIFAVGDSAGAHNLSLYAAICSNTDYAKKYSFSVPDGFIPTAIALNCGQYKIEITGNKDDLIESLMADYLPEAGSENELHMVSVINHVTENYPPTMIMTSVGDFLKNQAPIMATCLTEHNVPFTYKYYGDSQNQLGHVFHCNIKLEDANICNDDECEFFRGFIR
jgi:acetyl esterase/lipase